MTTLRDLSRHLNISVTQISRALNGHDDVSAETRKRVQAAAHELGYQPNLAARKLVSGRSGIVALVVEPADSPIAGEFFLEMAKYLSATFSRSGLQFVLHVADTEQDRRDIYRKLTNSGTIDGFIVIEPVEDDERVVLLRERNVPFTIHGRLLDGTKHAFFDIDNFAVGQELAKMVLSKGHRKILFLNGEARRTYAILRKKGFQHALSEAGVGLDEAAQQNGTMTAERGLVDTIKAFSSGDRPTALICGNVKLAEGAMEALHALGLRVPEDVSVVTHDDILPGKLARNFDPPLSATEAPLAEGWSAVAETLQAAIEDGDSEKTEQIGAFEVVERASVAELKSSLLTE